MSIVHTQDSVYYSYYIYDRPVNFTGIASCVDEGRQSKKDNNYISKSTCYYPGGQLNRIYHYRNGNSHGKCIEYYQSGQIKMEFENWNGKQVGLWKWYNDKGEVTQEKDYGPK
jgi:antitoxin component YwqK of YwqJK toxin-antitoxin module